MSIVSVIGSHSPPREEPNRAAEPNASIEKARFHRERNIPRCWLRVDHGAHISPPLALCRRCARMRVSSVLALANAFVMSAATAGTVRERWRWSAEAR